MVPRLGHRPRRGIPRLAAALLAVAFLTVTLPVAGQSGDADQVCVNTVVPPPTTSVVPESAGDRRLNFGSRIEVDGDTILVTAPNEPRNEPGTDADLSRRVDGVGRVHVLTRVDGGWSHVQALGPETDEKTIFGGSIALDGDTAVVGGHYGRQVRNGSGEVWIFTREDGTWTRTQRLAFPDEEDPGFGYQLALQDGTLMVAQLTSAHSVDEADHFYVYTRSGDTWQRTQTITFDEDDLVAGSGDIYGRAHTDNVDLDGDTAVFGGPEVVYVYARSGDRWTRAEVLTADLPVPNRFGSTLALDGNTVVAGDPWPRDATNNGAVYVFTRSGGSWGPAQELLGPKMGGINHRFGFSVDVDGDRLVVGQLSEAVQHAYLYRRSGDAWTQEARFQGQQLPWPVSETPDQFWSAVGFGVSARFAGDQVLVGASWGFVEERASEVMEPGETGAFMVFRPGEGDASCPSEEPQPGGFPWWLLLLLLVVLVVLAYLYHRRREEEDEDEPEGSPPEDGIVDRLAGWTGLSGGWSPPWEPSTADGEAVDPVEAAGTAPGEASEEPRAQAGEAQRTQAAAASADALAPLLAPGEQVRWQAGPARAPIYLKHVVGSVVPALLLGIVLVPFVYLTFALGAGGGADLLAIVAVVGLLALLVAGPVTAKLRCDRTVYAVTDGHLVLSGGIIRRDHEATRLDEVRDVEVEVGVLDRVFGTGTLRFAGTDTSFGHVRDPDAARSAIAALLDADETGSNTE